MMNRTRLVYKVCFIVSGILFAITAMMALLGTGLQLQISSLSLGLLVGSLASHLRLRMVLAGQRAGRRAVALGLARAEPVIPAMGNGAEGTVMEGSATDLGAILTGLGDVQAELAANESFLLSELMTLRQRLLTLHEIVSADDAAVPSAANGKPSMGGWAPITKGDGETPINSPPS